jgi:hypothetical protein
VSEQQLLRMAKRRLAILRHAEEVTANVALTSRHYGLGRGGSANPSSRWTVVRLIPGLTATACLLSPSTM